jgi:hygromycin-B 7''-O-kinase
MGSRNGLRRVPDIHLLVNPNPDDWSLSGLFDFEPAMRGARECEFASVGLFVARGDARFPRRLLLAYGYRPHQLYDELPRPAACYALLHRYSDLPWWLEQLPPAADAHPGGTGRPLVVTSVS